MAAGSLGRPDAMAMLRKSVMVAAFWLHTLAQAPERMAEVVRELIGIVGRTDIRPLIGAVYPLEKGAEALLALESRATVGKLLLKP